MSAALQVFFKHCFCREYSQCMRPTSGDTIVCLCTHLQTPILMTKLDRDSEPWLKTKRTQDRFKGRSSNVRPYATPRPIVSIASHGAGFEALMAEQHANPPPTLLHLLEVAHTLRLPTMAADSTSKDMWLTLYQSFTLPHTSSPTVPLSRFFVIVCLRTTCFITYFGL